MSAGDQEQREEFWWWQQINFVEGWWVTQDVKEEMKNKQNGSKKSGGQDAEKRRPAAGEDGLVDAAVDNASWNWEEGLWHWGFWFDEWPISNLTHLGWFIDPFLTIV